LPLLDSGIGTSFASTGSLARASLPADQKASKSAGWSTVGEIVFGANPAVPSAR
jgi:hypothetical protein